MKVLVTGAAGFLGSWFLDYFIKRGSDEVWSIDIRPHPTGIPIDQQDMAEWLGDFKEDVDVAFHFAAPVGGRMKIEHDPMYNADAFRLDSAFYRWAVKHAKLAVYPSSSAIYPVTLQTNQYDMPLYESMVHPSHANWGAPDELYGFSKLAGEVMGWKAATKHGLDVLAIRPFSGYGPNQSFDYPIPSILRRVVNREDPVTVWGAGQTRDFIYVTDIVEATMGRIEEGVDGFEVMNIASGVGHTFPQIAEMAARIEGYRPEIVEDPSKPTGVAQRRGDTGLMLRYHRPSVDLLDGLKWTMDSLREPVPA